METNPVPRLFTVSETAKILGINPKTIRRWDNCGKIKARRNGITNHRIFTLEEVNQLKALFMGEHVE